MRPALHAMTFGLLACHLVTPANADPNALWHIVHDRCVPHQEQFRAPFPCLETDERDGIALLKDIVGDTQTLLIPTARVTGLEDPAVLDPAAPNYFQLAWQRIGTTRALADAALPRDALSLAMNSVYGRTQNQLHIHIDCIRPDVRTLLAEDIGAVTDAWTEFPVPLHGHSYRARRVWTLDRPGANPFQLVAADLPGARADMAAMTIVVVGATFSGEPGFILLAGQADLATGNPGSGEELQDHGCALAHPH
ncbi:MAG: CDP-diacylglycerol diphosphatase [Acetobacteraceae bacterium]